jgi:hypothetical protein
VLRLAVLGIGAALVLSVSSPTAAREPVFRVSLQRTPCFGACPVYTVSVTGDRRVVFVGRRFVDAVGVRRARLSPRRFARLRAAVTAARVFTLRSRYDEMLVTDLPSSILTVRVGPRRKRIYRYHGDRSAPERLRLLECQIDRLARTSRWVGKPTTSYCRIEIRSD